MHAKSLQSCPTFCNPMDYSQPDSSVHGILQARTLEWSAMLSARGASWLRDVLCLYWQAESLPLALLGWTQCNYEGLYKTEVRGSESEKKIWRCKRLEGCENRNQGIKAVSRSLKIKEIVIFCIFHKECIPVNQVCIENIQNSSLYLISVLASGFLH